MRISRRAALLAFALALALATPARAQIEVDAATQVRSIRFEGVESISQRTLTGAMRTRPFAPLRAVQVLFGKLPVVPGPAPRPFSPLELQKDVVRLRRAYARSGFVEATIRYDVVKDEKKNLLDITFVVD